MHQIFDLLSKGDIQESLTEEYKGDFNMIRNSLNILIDATKETTRVAEEIASGNITVEIRERSEQDRMVKALNRMIQKLSDIMKETDQMIRAVGEGRLDIRGNADAFEGSWQDIGVCPTFYTKWVIIFFIFRVVIMSYKD